MLFFLTFKNIKSTEKVKKHNHDLYITVRMYWMYFTLLQNGWLVIGTYAII